MTDDSVCLKMLRGLSFTTALGKAQNPILWHWMGASYYHCTMCFCIEYIGPRPKGLTIQILTGLLQRIWCQAAISTSVLRMICRCATEVGPMKVSLVKGPKADGVP